MSRPSSVNSGSSQHSHAELNDSIGFSWPEPGPKPLHHSHETGLDLRPPQQPKGLTRPGSFSGPLSLSYDSDLGKEVSIKTKYNILITVTGQNSS